METEQTILEIEREIILDKDSPLKRIDAENREVPITNDLEGYIFSCSQSLSLLSASMDKARLSIEVLKSSYESVPQGSKFTADEFIELAIENYFVRSAAIYDRCLILTNKILELGIANESICHDLLVTNDHVIKHGIKDKLKAVRKKCTEYRVQRNKIVHHGRYSEEAFDTISAMHKVNSYQIIEGKEPTYSDELIDMMTNEVIGIQVDEFSAHLESVVAKVHALYDAVLPVYQMKKNEHKQ